MSTKTTTKTTKEIEQLLIAAKEAYYSGADLVLDDMSFDSLEDLLRQRDPESEYFKIVGTESAVSEGKFAHAVPMLSMQKANTLDEIVKWSQRIHSNSKIKTINLVAEPKIDGNSVSLTYNKGKLIRALTRGDGKMGHDITHIAKQIKDIPQTVAPKDEFEVRGELYLPKNTTLETNGKPLRNIVAGLLNPKRSDISGAKHVRFVACRLVSYHDGVEHDLETECLEFLKQHFPNVVPYQTFKGIDKLQAYYEKHDKGGRHNYEFELDGLVIIANSIELQEAQPNTNDHHLDYHIAYKFSNEMKRTTLRTINWQMSRHGNLIPIANFEIVVIGGTRIGNATLNNAANVEALKLMMGDEVEVTRANDVVPYLARNLSYSESVSPKGRNYSPLIPSNCPCCNTELEWEGVHLHCPNNECEEQQIQKIVHWVVTCEMDGVSESTVRTLFTEGHVKKIKDLYTLANDPNALHSIDGFGESKIENLLAQIERSKTMSIHQFVDRLGIPSVGEKAAKKLGINSFSDLFNFKSDGSAIGDAVDEWLFWGKEMALNLSRTLILTDFAEKKGLRVCATGKAPMQRKDLIKLLEANGFVWADGVDKDLHMLLCDDPESGSSKNKKAAKLGIKVMTYDAFLASLS